MLAESLLRRVTSVSDIELGIICTLGLELQHKSRSAFKGTKMTMVTVISSVIISRPYCGCLCFTSFTVSEVDSVVLLIMTGTVTLTTLTKGVMRVTTNFPVIENTGVCTNPATFMYTVLPRDALYKNVAL